MTHAQTIESFGTLAAKFAPVLKPPAVEMPIDGFSHEDYAQQPEDEYAAAGIPPENMWPRSFDLNDIRNWVENTHYGAYPRHDPPAVAGRIAHASLYRVGSAACHG